MTFRELVHGCWWTHAETIWEAGHFRCLQCGTTIDVLPQAVIRGPRHHPEPVRGQPKLKAKLVRSAKVREFRQSER